MPGLARAARGPAGRRRRRAPPPARPRGRATPPGATCRPRARRASGRPPARSPATIAAGSIADGRSSSSSSARLGADIATAAAREADRDQPGDQQREADRDRVRVGAEHEEVEPDRLDRDQAGQRERHAVPRTLRRRQARTPSTTTSASAISAPVAASCAVWSVTSLPGTGATSETVSAWIVHAALATAPTSHGHAGRGRRPMRLPATSAPVETTPTSRIRPMPAAPYSEHVGRYQAHGLRRSPRRSASAATIRLCRSRSRRERPISAARLDAPEHGLAGLAEDRRARSARRSPPPSATSSSAAGRAARQSATAPTRCSVTSVRPSSCTGQLSGCSSAASTALPISVAAALADIDDAGRRHAPAAAPLRDQRRCGDQEPPAGEGRDDADRERRRRRLVDELGALVEQPARELPDRQPQPGVRQPGPRAPHGHDAGDDAARRPRTRRSRGSPSRRPAAGAISAVVMPSAAVACARQRQAQKTM